MIGSGIFNLPIMGNPVSSPIQIITKLCFTGIVETVLMVSGIVQENFPLTGIMDAKIKLIGKAKQGCDDGC